MAQQWRAVFDAEVDFANGGGLSAHGFRLDIAADDISDADLAALFVRHLGLLLVGAARITRKEIVAEPHRGSRGVDTGAVRRRVVEVSDADSRVSLPVALTALVDLSGSVVRVPTATTAIDRLLLAPYPVAGRAVLIPDGAYLTRDAAEFLVAEGVALIATGSAAADDGDTPVVDDLLRAARIPVVTGLIHLDDLPPTGFRFHAVPMPGGRSAPVRAYAVVGA